MRENFYIITGGPGRREKIIREQMEQVSPSKSGIYGL